MYYRLNIDLRTAASELKEEQMFETMDAAERYYSELRARYAAPGVRVESRSSISQFLGGSQAQFWSVCKHFEENVKREFVWWKK
jgi:hypothetical protein